MFIIFPPEIYGAGGGVSPDYPNEVRLLVDGRVSGIFIVPLRNRNKEGNLANAGKLLIGRRETRGSCKTVTEFTPMGRPPVDVSSFPAAT
jgi:hypothetical protein